MARRLASVAAAGLTSSAIAVGGAAVASAQEASAAYPNYPEWYSAGLPWVWFLIITAIVFLVSIVVTIVLSGKNSRRTGRREGGL